METEIKTVADVVAEFKAVRKSLGDNDAAHQRAAADFAERLRKVEERAAFAGKRETAPVGGEAALLSRFMRADGSIAMVRGVERSTFAGQPVEVEREGLFSDAPATEWDAELKRLAVARTVYRHAYGRSTPVLDARLLAHAAKAPTAGGFRAALEKSISDTTGSGAEWIPDTPIATLYEDYFTPAGIAALFPSQAIRGPILVPSITDTGRPYLKGVASTNDPAQYTASDVSSASTTINPAGFAFRMVVDDSATEDAIFALLPEIARRAARAVLDGYEDCMINGDTTATHEDAIASWNIRSRWGSSGLGGSADHRRAFKGFRRIAVDRTATSDLSAAQTAAGVMGLVGVMGELAASGIALITSPEVLYQKLMVDSNVLTVDKFGPRATLVTGQLAAIGGHPLVTSRWMSADLASTGLYTGSGAKSGLIAVSRGEFTHYESRATTVEQDKDITRGVYNVVSTLRRSLITLSSTSQKVAAFGINML
jgi:hypothetical protein